jgi:hypothetical protein
VVGLGPADADSRCACSGQGDAAGDEEEAEVSSSNVLETSTGLLPAATTVESTTVRIKRFKRR